MTRDVWRSRLLQHGRPSRSLADVIRGRDPNKVPDGLSQPEAIEYIKARADYRNSSSGGSGALVGWLLVIVALPLFFVGVIPGVVILVIGVLVLVSANRRRREFLRAKAVYEGMNELIKDHSE